MVICNPGIKPKNKHLQSFLASSKLRLLRLKKDNPLVTDSEQVILQTKEAILQGFYTPQSGSQNLYILLHGWEGSANSTYIQLLANILYEQKKAAIFRLNFRDHGDTHHLNEELFHSCRLDEVVDAIQQVIEKYPHKNVFLCGFSLGGNFSLRVAAKAYNKNININKVFAISPPLVPKNSMLAIEKSRIYSQYFLKKWKKSLTKKSQLFPEKIVHEDFIGINCLETLTRKLIIKHSEYETTDAYFDGYAISETVLNDIKIPCEILTAWDDPVIPFDDFMILEKRQNIRLITTKFGGHCGFINSWKMNSWIEEYIIANS